MYGSSERPKSRQTIDTNLSNLKKNLNLSETPDLEAYRAMNIGKQANHLLSPGGMILRNSNQNNRDPN